MPAQLQNVELTVEGMHCHNCASGIERRLKYKGAENVSVNFSTSTARFSLQQSADVKPFISEIEQLGYVVTPAASRGHAHDGVGEKTFWTIERKFLFSVAWTLPLMLHMFVSAPFLHSPYVQLVLCIPVYVLGAAHFGRSAIRGLSKGLLHMDLLILIGISAAFFYSLAGTLLDLGSDFLFYETAASIVCFVFLGNVLEHRSVKKTTSAIEELAKIQPERAKKVDGEKVVDVSLQDVRLGDLLLVNSGDKLPTDGEVVWGEATVDQSMISGESIPVEVAPGSAVVGGTLVQQGSLKVRVTALGDSTVLANIIKLVRTAQEKKPAIQRIGDVVSSVFIPVVLTISALTFVLSYFVFGLAFQGALLHSIAVLVIACPCAMGLATPTAVMVGIGRAARAGILIKGGETLERLADVKTMIFDKTGTLTSGKFKVTDFRNWTSEEPEAESVIAALERHSSHPIAQSMRSEFASVRPYELSDVRETKGRGMSGRDAAGNTYELGSYSIAAGKAEPGWDLYLLKNGALRAALRIEDEQKEGVSELLGALTTLAIEPVLLSGDRAEKCARLAERNGIKRVFAQKLPHEKQEIVKTLERESPAAFVGDGINDAPSLAQAQVGISLSDATQVAISSSQVVLLNGSLRGIPTAVLIGRMTLRTIKQNLFWAFFYNVIAIPLAAMGYLSPMLAAFTMAFSDVIVIGNSLRLRTRAIENT